MLGELTEILEWISSARHPKTGKLYKDMAFRLTRSLEVPGNSDGDYAVQQWTTAGSGPRFGMIIHQRIRYVSIHIKGNHQSAGSIKVWLMPQDSADRL